MKYPLMAIVMFFLLDHEDSLIPEPVYLYPARQQICRHLLLIACLISVLVSKFFPNQNLFYYSLFSWTSCYDVYQSVWHQEMLTKNLKFKCLIFPLCPFISCELQELDPASVMSARRMPAFLGTVVILVPVICLE
jgi:hypothetical protein